MYGETFGLSEPTASRHQAEFATLFEKRCGEMFERDEKRRVRGGRLILRGDAQLPREPVFQRMPKLSQWLQQNLGGNAYFEECIKRRDPDPWVMRPLIRSIRSKIPIRINYHSRNGQSERVVSPHAIILVAERMHMRAFDHSNNEHRDFVLSRVTEVETVMGEFTYVGSDQDVSWVNFKKLVIEEKHMTSEENARIGVCLDFGLDKYGSKTVQVREALIHYLIDNMSEAYSSPIRIREAGGKT
ncbi:hypothetical protein ACSSVY_002006 [Roseovarius sp. MBR-51]